VIIKTRPFEFRGFLCGRVRANCEIALKDTFCQGRYPNKDCLPLCRTLLELLRFFQDGGLLVEIFIVRLIHIENGRTKFIFSS